LTVPNAPSKLDAVHDRVVQFAGQLQDRQPGDEQILPVLPALTPLLPAGGLVKGSVTAIGAYGMLCLALMAGASAKGAWCAVAGIPEFGVAAAAAAGVEPDRLLLVPDPGERWLQVAAALLDGCEIVLIRPPAQPASRARRQLEAGLRRAAGVWLVAGPWDGAAARLRVTRQHWAGLGNGHGRLRACRAEVLAEGRAAAAQPRRQWLWLPAPDGTIAEAGPGESLPGLSGAGISHGPRTEPLSLTR
jgi:hypothetical protein